MTGRFRRLRFHRCVHIRPVRWGFDALVSESAGQAAVTQLWSKNGVRVQFSLPKTVL